MNEFPSSLDDIFQINFNFDKLINALQFLNTRGSRVEKEIKDLQNKILEIDDISNTISDLKLKITLLEKNLKEANDSIENHQSKLLEFDTKFQEATEKITQVTESTKALQESSANHEENLNNLNRVVEEHIKSTKELEKNMNSIDANILQTVVRIESTEKKIKDIEKDSNESNKSIKQEIKEVHSQMLEMKSSFEKKNKDIDKTMTNLINNVSGLKSDNINTIDNNQTITSPKTSRPKDIVHTTPIVRNDDTNNEDLNNFIRTTQQNIEVINNKVDKYYFEFDEFKRFINDENTRLKQEVENSYNKFQEIVSNSVNTSMVNAHQSNQNSQQLEGALLSNNIDKPKEKKIEKKHSSTKNKNDGGELSDLSLETLNELVTKSVIGSTQFKKINENIRILCNSMGSKVPREDLDTMNRTLLSKIDKLSDRLNESLSFYDNKLKNLKNVDNPNGTNMANFDFNFFTQNLETSINDQLANYGSKMLKNDLENLDWNDVSSFKNLLDTLKKHTEELDKCYKSIVDIRNSFVKKTFLDDFYDLKNKNSRLEEENKKIKITINEMKKSIEGNEDDDENNITLDENLKNVLSEYNNTTQIKKKFLYLTIICQRLINKVNELENKGNEINKDIKEGIKAQLKTETVKVMENFKMKLDSFTNRFDHELKNKIDLMGLSTFEHKINNKLYVEMKNKLDKSDLKKNNNTISKKIDSLENKISKTVVDAIIDLQMDEAPLIVKKNMNNVQKCASCNQPLPLQMQTFPSNPSKSLYYSTDKFKGGQRFVVKDRLPELTDSNINK